MPARYMQSLLDFFSSYNFTIDENDPDDAEVGVDPEMLGRIFENLLEDNKDKGAFYTPKEIVTYMCRESLIAYLQTDIEDEATKEAIRQFVTTHQVLPNLPADIDQKLKDVKICDPAIGSGAFPMGLLKELFLCRTALEGISQHQAAEIKKHIIQQNIYGVDIERGAVDIARLRFWLALIVDEEMPQALPNLDFKIMQGNSLLEQYKGVDLSTMTERKYDANTGLSFFDNMVDVYRQELRDMLARYYDCTDHKEKQCLRTSIIDNVKKQLSEQSIHVNFGSLDLSGNSQFFLWHTWFHDVFANGGFDIVIGNPPYNELRDYSVIDQELYRKSCLYRYAKGGRVNMFQYFYPLGIYIGKKKSVCSYITQNSLLAEESAIGNRKLIFETCHICSIDSFPERDNVKLRVFEAAKMSVCICLLRKNASQCNHAFDIKVWKDKFMTSGETLSITKSEIKEVYPEELILPICSRIKWNILLKMRSISNFSINAQAGEIDMTKYKPLFSDDKSLFRIVTGAQVLRYRLTDTPSQGKVIYMNAAHSNFSNDRINAINNLRIVAQRITGVDSKIRLIGTIIPQKTLCANSTNYISVLKNDIDLYYLLGVFNSKCINFFFKQTSTNTNVTGKEIAKFPIVSESVFREKIHSLVKTVLEAKHNIPSADTSALESEIDHLVYHLYGLTYNEVLIVDPETPITRDEYEKVEKN